MARRAQECGPEPAGCQVPCLDSLAVRLECPRAMLTAFILVKSTRDGLTHLGAELADVEGVAEVYTVTGEWDFIAVARVREHEDLAKVGTHHLPRPAAIERT